jgi:hypothetical protein
MHGAARHVPQPNLTYDMTRHTQQNTTGPCLGGAFWCASPYHGLYWIRAHTWLTYAYIDGVLSGVPHQRGLG